jgi:tetratricopeptide (TPR) repeat protein
MARVEPEHADAVVACRASLAAAEQAFGPSHPVAAAAASRVAKALGKAGDHAEALALYERAQPIAEIAYGKESADAAHGLCSIGLSLARLGRTDEGRGFMERCLAIMDRKKEDDPFTAAAHLLFADLLISLGDVDAAIEHLRRGREINERLLGPDHPDMVMTYGMQANIYGGAERWAESASLAATCAAKAKKVDEQHPLLGLCLMLQAQALIHMAPGGEVVPVARAALRAIDVEGANPTNVGIAHAVLAEALELAGDRAGARREIDIAITILKTRGPGAADYLKAALDVKRQL